MASKAFKRKGREKEYDKEWRKSNKERVKRQKSNWHHENNYGISLEVRDAIFAAQGLVCAICGSSETKGKGWHTDHCHETNKVRGVLCHHCNLGLGNFFDRPSYLSSAINYLNKHHGNHNC